MAGYSRNPYWSKADAQEQAFEREQESKNTNGSASQQQPSDPQEYVEAGQAVKEAVDKMKNITSPDLKTVLTIAALGFLAYKGYTSTNESKSVRRK